MMMMMVCDCQQEGESSVPGGQGQCNGPDYDLRKINATQRPKKRKITSVSYGLDYFRDLGRYHFHNML